MPDRYNIIATRLWRQLLAAIDGLRRAHATHRTNIPLLARVTAHLGIIALTVIALLLSSVGIRAAGPTVNPDSTDNSELPPIQLGFEAYSGDLTISPVPFTIIPQRDRREVVEYVVAPGDTVTGIASRFHISPDSVLWANAKLQDNPDMLSLGQTLNIPPVSGVLYTVQSGDTLLAIANKFKAKVEDIFNDPLNQSLHDLKSNPPQLTTGAFLMVPGGSKPFIARKVTVSGSAPSGAARGTSNFVWPSAGCISQYFWRGHSGVDIAGPIGTPIHAADSGYVAVVGWDNTGYGNMILINHGNGFLTRYGHLSAFNVEPGQSVKKGAVIGRVGSTGHSTGPHLHFEVIFQGVPRNPTFFLTGRAPGRCYGY